METLPAAGVRSRVSDHVSVALASSSTHSRASWNRPNTDSTMLSPLPQLSQASWNRSARFPAVSHTLATMSSRVLIIRTPASSFQMVSQVEPKDLAARMILSRAVRALFSTYCPLRFHALWKGLQMSSRIRRTFRAQAETATFMPSSTDRPPLPMPPP